MISSFWFLTLRCDRSSSFFFFNDTATTEIYTLSLHDALPILDDGAHCIRHQTSLARPPAPSFHLPFFSFAVLRSDRKSTRLNSSHLVISYAVFCLKKKKTLHQLTGSRATSFHPIDRL